MARHQWHDEPHEHVWLPSGEHSFECPCGQSRWVEDEKVSKLDRMDWERRDTEGMDSKFDVSLMVACLAVVLGILVLIAVI